MEIWSLWLAAIHQVLVFFSDTADLGVGMSIIVTTLLLRALLLPVAWPIALRARIRQRKLDGLQPELQRLQDRFGSQPQIYMQKMLELYRSNGVTLMDGKTLLGAAAQIPLFLGMFQALRSVGDGARFLWVTNLLRPDLLLALIAGATTALMMVANPELPEQVRLFMIVVPSVIAILSALHFSSALAIYWSTSNAFSALQTLLLHFVMERRLRNGTLRM